MVTNVDGQDAYVTADPTLAQIGQRALPLYTLDRKDVLLLDLYAELDTNFRLRALGGARTDEPMTPFIERVIAERDELRRQVHNLNWALSMPGFEQMATPEDQAEHEAGVAAVDAVLARMEHNKAQHDAMVKAAERYRWLREHGDNHCTEKDGYGGQTLMVGDCLDAAVDAAMAPRPAVG
jgi:hypothetical protein